jgi:23S rRNA (cytosine1962-C5)-methyltransferase
VKENGVTYATYLNEGLMTGIFLDQKEVRGQLVDGLAAGKTVLNMFSYTGAFSVAAAVGGAAQTTSVDLAKRSLEKTREQFAVNGIDPDTQRIHVMDVFNYFNYASKKRLAL